MDISTSHTDEAVIMALEGRLNAVSAPELEKELNHIDEPYAILDMTGLQYISSAGLRTLLVTAKKLRQKGGDLVLAGLQDNVQHILDVSGFDSMLSIHDSLQDATESVSE